MQRLLLPFSKRYLALTLVILAAPLLLGLWITFPTFWLWILLPFLLAAVLSALGLYDLLQTRHAILRNYPIIAHLRFMLEDIRPELRQYFFENEKDGLPFPRDKRAIVYQRAKRELDKRPFGTQLDVYQSQYEWLHHSMVPKPVQMEPFRLIIGGPRCKQSYSASIFNISAMSYGALSANAIRSLNRGAKMGGFAHDTGEGSISPYHEEAGGDLIWEIGSGYFGCRKMDGSFSEGHFAETASNPQVKMIEVKLSQGAKPGHGGVLPAAKVTEEIAAIRGVEPSKDCISPASHSAFSTPAELLRFIDRLRELSGGKPAGFKLCVGHPWEFLGIVKAMLDTGLCRTLSWSTAKRAAQALLPLSSWIISVCHSAMDWPLSIRRSLVLICANIFASGVQARLLRVSTWPGSWHWVRTGVMRRVASCSRSDVSKPSTAIRELAPLALQRRTQCASEP